MCTYLQDYHQSSQNYESYIYRLLIATPKFPQKLEEKREKGICYSCDRKHTEGHKCAKKKLFYIDFE